MTYYDHGAEPPYPLQVARGKVSGAESFSGYGVMTTAGAVTDQVVWPNGTYLFPPAAGVQMSVVSTSPEDGAGTRTGINSLHIHRLAADLTVQSETVLLNGTTPVQMVAEDTRIIQCMHIGEDFGSAKAAVGTISAKYDNTDYSIILPGQVRCSSSIRMVPAGKRAVIYALFGGAASGSAAASVILKIGVTKFAEHDYTESSLFIPTGAAAYQDASSGIGPLWVPIVIEAGTAFGMLATTDKAAKVVGTWFGWLENAE